MAAVSAMAVMHEKMHYGTGQNEQERQHAKNVRCVLGEKIEGGDGKKAEQHDAASGAPQGRMCFIGHKRSPDIRIACS
jgi:hypothetical protein